MKRLTNISNFALFAGAMFMVSPQALAICVEGCLTNENTALGEDALANPDGMGNTGIGFNALHSDGQDNTAVGWKTQNSNAVGSRNVSLAPYSQENSASDSTALGYGVMTLNTGDANTGVGYAALCLNITGTSNVAVGLGALSQSFDVSRNVAVGFEAQNDYLVDGANNIVIGSQAHAAGKENNILVGTVGTNESGTLRLGDLFFTHYAANYIAGIRGTPLVRGEAIAVGITSDGQLGVRASSSRFKEAIKPMGQTSKAIFALKPVTFRYKKGLDARGTPQFGLVAEEVAKVDPDLIVTDDQGKPFTVRYEAVNAMLLNEFLEEHRRVEKVGSAVERHQRQINALTMGLQKLGAKVEMGDCWREGHRAQSLTRGQGDALQSFHDSLGISCRTTRRGIDLSYQTSLMGKVGRDCGARNAGWEVSDP